MLRLLKIGSLRSSSLNTMSMWVFVLLNTSHNKKRHNKHYGFLVFVGFTVVILWCIYSISYRYVTLIIFFILLSNTRLYFVWGSLFLFLDLYVYSQYFLVVLLLSSLVIFIDIYLNKNVYVLYKDLPMFSLTIIIKGVPPLELLTPYPRHSSDRGPM